MPPERRPRAPPSPEPTLAAYRRPQYDTPEKSRLITGIDFIKDFNLLEIPKTRVFQWAGFTKTAGYRALAQAQATSEGHGTNRRHHNDLETTEHRGRPPKITQEQIWQAERVLEEGIEVRVMTWEALAYEIGVDVSGRTLQRAMGRLDYHKCIACQKGWCSAKVAERRKQYAEVMIQRYPEPED